MGFLKFYVNLTFSHHWIDCVIENVEHLIGEYFPAATNVWIDDLIRLVINTILCRPIIKFFTKQ